MPGNNMLEVVFKLLRNCVGLTFILVFAGCSSTPTSTPDKNESHSASAQKPETTLNVSTVKNSEIDRSKAVALDPEQSQKLLQLLSQLEAYQEYNQHSTCKEALNNFKTNGINILSVSEHKITIQASNYQVAYEFPDSSCY